MIYCAIIWTFLLASILLPRQNSPKFHANKACAGNSAFRKVILLAFELMPARLCSRFSKCIFPLHSNEGSTNLLLVVLLSFFSAILQREGEQVFFSFFFPLLINMCPYASRSFFFLSCQRYKVVGQGGPEGATEKLSLSSGNGQCVTRDRCSFAIRMEAPFFLSLLSPAGPVMINKCMKKKKKKASSEMDVRIWT